uniref:HECT-type E3 ubiquitin transferase n=1 Tax=Noccaea caerulescens TaxID=107243 RepID=A0A1J3IAY7_NOCCA
MTLSRLPAADSTNTHRSSFSTVAGTDHHKRKFDDYASSSPDCGVDLLQRMKRHEVDADHTASSQKSFKSRGIGEIYPLPSAAECSSSAPESSDRSESTRLQLFVRMMSGKTLVIHADRKDTVEKLHQRIECKTRIPVKEQRVIYKGKQLQNEQLLSHYSIEQDASLQLVGRMQSTEHPVAWQTVDDIMHTVSRMHRGEKLYGGSTNINAKLVAFFSMIPKDNKDSIVKYLRIFSNSSVPAALVMLFASTLDINKSCAKSAIKLFLNSCIALPKNQQLCCLQLVLEFCRLLRRVCPENKLYATCRSTLGTMLEPLGVGGSVIYRESFTIGEEIFPFFNELAGLMVNELRQNTGPSLIDVQKFSSFWKALRNSIGLLLSGKPIALPLQNMVLEVEMGELHRLFETLLKTMDSCMSRIESLLGRRGIANTEDMSAAWSQYLAILKIINSMSELYEGAKEQVAHLLNSRKVSFCAIVLKFAKRDDDHSWIFDYKEATTFESRRHLAMLLFPDVKEDFEEMHEMLIDRSNLLAESFEYIAGASPHALHGGLFMEFKNEEATGPGVLREWFYLVCREIFNPQNALFLRSADDLRRFSPNTASKVDPLHPDFFKFAGRVIALALMHKVQVGVLFDRVFFLQLAGQNISLEDIKNTDRIMYNSCKQILEMDPVFFDSNAGLGLTFVLETEELGKRDTIELCKDGKSRAVDSKNREEYVDSLIKHRYATSISEQVMQFSKGFMDILSSGPPESFFARLNLEDLDGMLRGGEHRISIDDWRAHTEYNGFKETDHQIEWFWKILKKMTEEERRRILFFWTSTKFIPVEGFRGLSSKLYIYRLFEANDRLPVSHTCFYRLCLPKYPTIGLMEQRLRIIAQDHVSSSFGKW